MKYTPSHTNSVATPQYIKDAIEVRFGKYWDPCPLDENFTTNGLLLDWREHIGTNACVFVNPPYSKQRPWIRKALGYKGLTSVLLIKNESLGSRYFLKMPKQADIIFLCPHVQFEGYKKPARFSSLLLVIGPRSSGQFCFWHHSVQPIPEDDSIQPLSPPIVSVVSQ